MFHPYNTYGVRCEVSVEEVERERERELTLSQMYESFLRSTRKILNSNTHLLDSSSLKEAHADRLREAQSEDDIARTKATSHHIFQYILSCSL